MPQVVILMGSKSDEEKVSPCVDVLKSLGVSCFITVSSAHRTPERTEELVAATRPKARACLSALLAWPRIWPGQWLPAPRALSLAFLLPALPCAAWTRFLPPADAFPAFRLQRLQPTRLAHATPHGWPPRFWPCLTLRSTSAFQARAKMREEVEKAGDEISSANTHSSSVSPRPGRPLCTHAVTSNNAPAQAGHYCWSQLNSP